ncbi:WD repeat-containing protein 60 [Geranomyces variabilis]|uniref:WD repeat-containing protein 60 n=1 Tax=Geranomyces variabilis TaxID=109894 RepID=A0AAD5TNU0_9FUNG|nr:WD repeat-containing protein 60 [Geranomyces variabilis]
MTATKKGSKKPTEAPVKPAPAATGPGLRWGSEELSAPTPNKGSLQSVVDGAPAQDAYDEYAEDFEDYAEDFEDFEEFTEEEENIAPPESSPPPQSVVVKPVAAQPRGGLEPSSFHTPPKLPRADPMTEVQNATHAENERASSRQEQRAREDLNTYAMKPERVNSALPQRKFVGLETARKEAQRARTLTAAGKRQTQRAADLSNIITLDMCYYDLFDLHPMNEYELYIRNYGSSNAIQAATQCNEDRADEEAQTDPPSTETRWAQASSEQFVDSGTGTPWASSSQSRKLKAAAAAEGEAMMELDAKVDLLRLSAFVRRAGQVMDSLLEENAAQTGIPRTFTLRSTLSISQGCSPLKHQSYLQGREIRDICYANTDHRLVLIAYSPVSDTSSALPVSSPNGLETGGLLCLWRITDPTAPYRILACENSPTSCCFATTKYSLVFAGTDSGSVLAWDIQESPALHPVIDVGDGLHQITVQYPSYSTDGIYTLNGTHEEPIRRIVALPHAQESQAGGGGVDSFLFGRLGADDAGSFQIASTDEAGVMQLWTVIEHLDASFAASEMDFGMAMGSRIKLIRSTTVQASTAKRKHAPPVAIGVLDCKFHPADIDRFLIATDTGTILNESRFRSRCHPRAFLPSDNESTTILDAATCIDFNPHNGAVFLAGYASGTVRLFITSEATSRVAWEASKSPITLVRWSPQRAAVFYVLDARGVLRVWDLSESEADAAHIVTPTISTPFDPARNNAKGAATTTLVTFALSQTVSSPGTTASQMNLAAASMRNATVVFGFSDGTSEVHLLDQSLSEEAIDEASAVNVYVDAGAAQGQAETVAADYEDDEHEEYHEEREEMVEHEERLEDDDYLREAYQ